MVICHPEQARFVLWPFKLKSCSRIVGKQILLFLKGHCNSRFNFPAQFYQCSLLKLIRYQSFLCYSHCDINKVTFNKSFMLFWSTALSCFLFLASISEKLSEDSVLMVPEETGEKLVFHLLGCSFCEEARDLPPECSPALWCSTLDGDLPWTTELLPKPASKTHNL